MVDYSELTPDSGTFALNLIIVQKCENAACWIFFFFFLQEIIKLSNDRLTIIPHQEN